MTNGTLGNAKLLSGLGLKAVRLKSARIMQHDALLRLLYFLLQVRVNGMGLIVPAYLSFNGTGVAVCDCKQKVSVRDFVRCKSDAVRPCGDHSSAPGRAVSYMRATMATTRHHARLVPARLPLVRFEASLSSTPYRVCASIPLRQIRHS